MKFQLSTYRGCGKQDQLTISLMYALADVAANKQISL